MDANTRTAFSATDTHTDAAMTPILFELPGHDVSGVAGATALPLSIDRTAAGPSSAEDNGIIFPNVVYMPRRLFLCS